MFKSIAYKHGIIVHAFPSKTMHKMQPLDVGVFSIPQHAWTKHCDECLAEGVNITCYNFIHEYMVAHKAITPELVQKAFAKTGLYPLNLSVFNARDFAPSIVLAPKAYLPPSYLQETPSSQLPVSKSHMDAAPDLDANEEGLGSEEELDSEEESDGEEELVGKEDSDKRIWMMNPFLEAHSCALLPSCALPPSSAPPPSHALHCCWNPLLPFHLIPK